MKIALYTDAMMEGPFRGNIGIINEAVESRKIISIVKEIFKDNLDISILDYTLEDPVSLNIATNMLINKLNEDHPDLFVRIRFSLAGQPYIKITEPKDDFIIKLTKALQFYGENEAEVELNPTSLNYVIDNIHRDIKMVDFTVSSVLKECETKIVANLLATSFASDIKIRNTIFFRGKAIHCLKGENELKDETHNGRYYNKNGELQYNWIDLPTGDKMYANEYTGKLKQNEWLYEDGSYYYFNNNCKMVRCIESDTTNNVRLGDTIYRSYVINNSSYLFNPDGTCAGLHDKVLDAPVEFLTKWYRNKYDCPLIPRLRME